MGILGDLIDDVLSVPGKIVHTVVDGACETACVVTGGHEWTEWRLTINGTAFTRRCIHCSREDKRK